MRNFQVYDIISAINSSSILSHNSFYHKDNHLTVCKLPNLIIYSIIIAFFHILHLNLHYRIKKKNCTIQHNHDWCYNYTYQFWKWNKKSGGFCYRTPDRSILKNEKVYIYNDYQLLNKISHEIYLHITIMHVLGMQFQ